MTAVATSHTTTDARNAAEVMGPWWLPVAGIGQLFANSPRRQCAGNRGPGWTRRRPITGAADATYKAPQVASDRAASASSVEPIGLLRSRPAMPPLDPARDSAAPAQHRGAGTLSDTARTLHQHRADRTRGGVAVGVVEHGGILAREPGRPLQGDRAERAEKEECLL